MSPWRDDQDWTSAPRSTLGRLFMWGRFARENFLTEALAAAIRADLRQGGSEVFRSAVAALLPPTADSPFPDPNSVLGLAHDFAIVDVATQVQLSGDGILDMLVEFTSGELWIEVKAGSPEGSAPSTVTEQVSEGDFLLVVDPRRQLNTYLDVANRISAEDGRRRAVLLLSTDRLGRDDVPWLPWRLIRTAITSAERVSCAWVDFARFLEESRVADDTTDRIRPIESVSIGPAISLTRKAAEVAWRVHEGSVRPRRLPTYAGPGAMLNLMGHQLAVDGSLLATATNKRLGFIGYGLVENDGEAWWALSVHAFKLTGPFARSVRELPSLAALAAQGWRYRDGMPDLLVKSRRALEFRSPDEAAAWLTGGFDELDAAGVVSLLFPTLEP